MTYQHLAQLAPILKEAELRVFIFLAAHAQPPDFVVLASSRDIASATKLARSAIVRAIDSLTERCYITTRVGTATKSSGYIVNALKTAALGGPLGGPPPVQNDAPDVLYEDHPGLQNGQQVVLFEAEPGPLGGPPSNNETRARATRVDSISDPITDNIDRGKPALETPIETGNREHDAIIERVLRSKPEFYTPSQLEDARRWIQGYQAKFGRYERDKGEVPHPPDPRILAHIIAAAEPWGVESLIYSLMVEKQEAGEKYSWYVTVALQRVHGIQPATFAAVRAKLRAISGGKALAQSVTQALTLGIKGIR